MIYIILLLVVVSIIGSSMLVFEDLGQNTLVATALVGGSRYVHSSSMDGIELVLDVA